MEPFNINAEKGRRDRRDLLLATEQRSRIAPDTLAGIDAGRLRRAGGFTGADNFRKSWSTHSSTPTKGKTALNEKGSRCITVDGVDYRWRIRRKLSCMQGLCWTPMTYAVEGASDSQSGTTLIVTGGQAHPSNWVSVETEAIRPAHVAASIREARDQGWDPVLLASSTDPQDLSPRHEIKRSREAHLPRHHGRVTTWMRCYWDEEDVWFYFEVDAEGWVLRQVELQGAEAVPIAAASLAEWQQARDAGRLDEYDRRFGSTAELPVSDWEGHQPERLTFEGFEEVWRSARRRIASRPD